jgi:hypothetical protein
MFTNHIPSTRALASAAGSCSGFRPASIRKGATGLRVGLHNRIRSRFIVAATAALIFALPCGVFAQSPLTVQPSTGRVGVGNTNPSEALDVSGTVKATAFKGDGSQLTNLPIGGSPDTADVVEAAAVEVNQDLLCIQRRADLLVVAWTSLATKTVGYRASLSGPAGEGSSGGSVPMPPGRSTGPLRFKLGDVIEGFQLV